MNSNNKEGWQNMVKMILSDFVIPLLFILLLLFYVKGN